MHHFSKLSYVAGQWQAPLGTSTWPVTNPATEEIVAEIVLGEVADVSRAVRAARKAAPAYAEWSVPQRLALLERIISVLERRRLEIADQLVLEIGVPSRVADQFQNEMTLQQLRDTAAALKEFDFELHEGGACLRFEPIGVCALITPWNAPVWQLANKLAPALAAGCTSVVKPSELAPLSTLTFMDILHEAGVPAGVVNLVNGTGETVGRALSKHPCVDMVSITGSTRAGAAVACDAAATIKRVHQELGGKSPNLILEDADVSTAVPQGVAQCFANSGQACSAPSRMIVPASRYDEVLELAQNAADRIVVGDPTNAATELGPIANRPQYERVQALIAKGIDEGARLVSGGLGRPRGIERGFFARPTVFADVLPGMTVAREEIFGPVLSIFSARDEDEAVRLANDTSYGLAAYVSSSSRESAARISRRLRAGTVVINGGPKSSSAPSGGYRQSGNGRQNGRFGLQDYLEVKAIHGMAEFSREVSL